MAADNLRVTNFNLGLRLGWLQQGAAFGGRNRALMLDDLRSIRDTADSLHYAGHHDAVARATRMLTAGQPATAIVPDVNATIVLLQRQASGIYAAALNVGIDLGVVQQGSVASTRPAAMAIADLGRVRVSASLAGYGGYEAFIDPQIAQLAAGVPIFNLLNSFSALIGFFQGQDVGAPPSEPDSGDSYQLPDANNIVQDPWFGGQVYRGEIVCRFKESTSTASALALIASLGLTKVGQIADLRVYQLKYNPAQWTLESLTKRLNSEPLVDAAIANAVLDWSAIPEVRPSEFSTDQSRIRSWHLVKLEAFAAFGLLGEIDRSPISICFIEKGLGVANGQAHSDFASRLRLRESVSMGILGPNFHPTVTDLAESDQTVNGIHGTKAVGVACASWNDGGAMGLDPEARVALIQCPRSVFHFYYALKYAANRISNEMKILNITLSGGSGWVSGGNLFLRPMITALIDKGALLVISAGNDNGPVDDKAISSIHEVLYPNYRKQVIVTGGTSLDGYTNVDAREVRWAEWGGGGGSNYVAEPSQKLIDLAAPANGVGTCGVGNSEMGVTGNSFATPIVSGVAALVFSVLPESASVVKTCLVETADPIIYGAGGTTPPYRLSADRYIGSGRVNAWQALLWAVNERERRAGRPQRYVGLRMTADIEGLHTYLEYGDNAPYPPSPPLNNPSTTAAQRLSVVSNGAGRASIRLRDNSGGPRYLQVLDMSTTAVDALGPRYVYTLRMFTQGRMTLRLTGEDTGAAARVKLSIRNLGTAPTDVELLDPEARARHDKSLRRWMRLAAGDSFALVAKLPPGSLASVEFLDSAMQTFEPERHDDDGNPYVTIPFGQTAPFYLQMKSMPGSTPLPVEVTAFSLNNRLVTASVNCLLGNAPVEVVPTETVLGGPAFWPKYASIRVRNTRARPIYMQMRSVREPSTWFWDVAPINFNLAPGAVKRVALKFEAPIGPQTPPEPVGTRCSCHLYGEDPTSQETHVDQMFPGVIGDPPVVRLESAQPLVADKVFALDGENYVAAEFPVAIVNDSPYAVRLWRFDVERVNPGGVDNKWIDLPALFAQASHTVIAARSRVETVMRCRYPKSAAVTPPAVGPVWKNTGRFWISDPNTEFLHPEAAGPPPQSFFKYQSEAFVVTVRLVVPPEG